MLKSASILCKNHNFLKNTHIFRFSSSQNEHKNQINYDKLIKDYENDIKKHSSDFKNIFGFTDNLNEKRLEAKKQEKKFNSAFIFIWVILFTGGEI